MKRYVGFAEDGGGGALQVLLGISKLKPTQTCVAIGVPRSHLPHSSSCDHAAVPIWDLDYSPRFVWGGRPHRRFNLFILVRDRGKGWC